MKTERISQNEILPRRMSVTGAAILTIMVLTSFDDDASAASIMKSYRVKAGDTVPKIAEFYGITPKVLKKANGIEKSSSLRRNQKLRIPAVLSRKPNRIYTVEEEDNLLKIASKFDISIRALSMANQIDQDVILNSERKLIIPLEDANKNPVFKPMMLETEITSGRVTELGIIHIRQPGQTIDSVAKAYNVSVEEIEIANHTMDIQDAKEVLIPLASTPVAVPGQVFANQPVHFIRLRNNQQTTLLLIDNYGDVSYEAQATLSTLAGEDGITQPPLLLDERLIRLLQQVADRFKGRSINVISGYRSGKKKSRKKGRESNHQKGRAIDFYVDGVPIERLYKFIKGFKSVGAGYYPNAGFVHLDTRELKTLWTDISGVGEKSNYTKVVTVPS